MRVNMSRWSTVVASMAIIGCGTASSEDETYGSGFVVVNEKTWGIDHTTLYPFTVPEGEISCGFHPEFGREVYFQPLGYTPRKPDILPFKPINRSLKTDWYNETTYNRLF